MLIKMPWVTILQIATGIGAFDIIEQKYLHMFQRQYG